MGICSEDFGSTVSFIALLLYFVVLASWSRIWPTALVKALLLNSAVLGHGTSYVAAVRNGADVPHPGYRRNEPQTASPRERVVRLHPDIAIDLARQCTPCPEMEPIYYDLSYLPALFDGTRTHREIYSIPEGVSLAEYFSLPVLRNGDQRPTDIESNDIAEYDTRGASGAPDPSNLIGHPPNSGSLLDGTVTIRTILRVSPDISWGAWEEDLLNPSLPAHSDYVGYRPSNGTALPTGVPSMSPSSSPSLPSSLPRSYPTEPSGGPRSSTTMPTSAPTAPPSTPGNARTMSQNSLTYTPSPTIFPTGPLYEDERHVEHFVRDSEEGISVGELTIDTCPDAAEFDEEDSAASPSFEVDRDLTSERTGGLIDDGNEGLAFMEDRSLPVGEYV